MSKRKTTSVIEQNVMAKIESNEIRIRPRAYYLAISSLSALIVLFFGFVTTYFMSVMLLWLRIQNADGPAYGARRNLGTLIESFPWWAFILGIISLFGIIFIIRKVGILYRVRLAYLVPIVVAATLLLGLALSYSAVPNTLQNHRTGCDTSDSSCAPTGAGPKRSQ